MVMRMTDSSRIVGVLELLSLRTQRRRSAVRKRRKGGRASGKRLQLRGPGRTEQQPGAPPERGFAAWLIGARATASLSKGRWERRARRGGAAHDWSQERSMTSSFAAPFRRAAGRPPPHIACWLSIAFIRSARRSWRCSFALVQRAAQARCWARAGALGE